MSVVSVGRLHGALLRSIVAVAAVLTVLYVTTHGAYKLVALAIAFLVVASVFDALSGTMPVLLLLAAVGAALASAIVDHRSMWIALLVVPFAYAAARSREEAFGWGDVLALLTITVALPFWNALAAIAGASAASLILSVFARARAERMTPYLALAAAIALWFPSLVSK